ncbi:MAG: DUF2970 domain-containing protein [Burkholderiales bacterium]|nr:DUF2970 domain-containing protein [Burkholderiales bacterium]
MKQASLLDDVKTVLSGAIGIRRKSDHDRATVSPVRIIIVAVVFVVLFVFALLAIVRIVTS